MPNATSRTCPAVRRDPWQDCPQSGVEYRLRAEAQADVLCRLLGLFAQLQLVPGQMQVQCRDGDMDVRLQLDGLSLHRANLLAEKLRALVCVWQVDWRHLNHNAETAILRTG
ncbi:hypothetical protein [Pseudomonas sp. NCCP-436]|uniref:hypothetical protein n=1 Tax=Pseudomonas sp. NCCP-436 TaxID=2842481 RepID=UPI001C812539|nr:hypothetical protein [Pseudomonas sp. NCCP-436]GIZ12449.1 hypothetical protein NCCP436_18650 [Pseudomonas sp. NCCP-436]